MVTIPNFSGRVSTDPGSDWAQASGPVSIAPRLVLSPTSVADVAHVVRWARTEGRRITPRAAATGMPGGNMGEDVILDLGPHGALAEIGPVDRSLGRVVVGPGSIAANVDRAARAAGFSLPALPSSAERCTIGGMVANNAAGARSFKSGAIAKRVHALTVVDAWGHVHRLERGVGGDDPFSVAAQAAPVVKRWPQVVKNSSGYALDRFHRSGDAIDVLVGSEGTLGVIVEITLDLTCPPEARSTLLVGANSDEALVGWTDIAVELGLSACEFVGPWLTEKARLAEDPVFGAVAKGSRSVMILEAEGSEAFVDRTADAIESLAEKGGTRSVRASTAEDQASIWGLRKRASPAIAEAASHGYRSMQFIEDSVVPRPALGLYLEGVDSLLREVGFDAAIFGHAGDANVHINPLVPIAESDWLDRVGSLLSATAGLVRDLGGTLAGEHGDGRIRAPYLETIWGPHAYGAFVALKHSLDPEGTFNPGVIVPSPGQDPLHGLGRL